MHLFLTSSPCDDNVPQGVCLPCILDARNGFVDRLAACWKPDSRAVIVSADPCNADLNDEMAQTFAGALAHHGLTLRDMTLIDARNEQDAARIVTLADFLILAGGHVPTQLAFFEQLGLRALLREFTGTVMGISAGTMNCARTVYVQPELPGESLDPAFVRFAPGLGLTGFMLLPHYQRARHFTLDGRRLYEDITYADSMGRAFIALVDGSYIEQHAGRATLRGEAYRIADGRLTQICRESEALELGEAL